MRRSIRAELTDQEWAQVKAAAALKLLTVEEFVSKAIHAAVVREHEPHPDKGKAA